MDLDLTILVHKSVRKWLMAEWDPIGVSDWPEAFDEYYSYERGIADLLIGNASEERLASHLVQQEERMGLTPDCGRATRAASRFKELYAELLRTQSSPE